MIADGCWMADHFGHELDGVTGWVTGWRRSLDVVGCRMPLVAGWRWSLDHFGH